MQSPDLVWWTIQARLAYRLDGRMRCRFPADEAGVAAYFEFVATVSRLFFLKFGDLLVKEYADGNDFWMANRLISLHVEDLRTYLSLLVRQEGIGTVEVLRPILGLLDDDQRRLHHFLVTRVPTGSGAPYLLCTDQKFRRLNVATRAKLQSFPTPVEASIAVKKLHTQLCDRGRLTVYPFSFEIDVWEDWVDERFVPTELLENVQQFA